MATNPLEGESRGDVTVRTDCSVLWVEGPQQNRLSSRAFSISGAPLWDAEWNQLPLKSLAKLNTPNLAQERLAVVINKTSLIDTGLNLWLRFPKAFMFHAVHTTQEECRKRLQETGGYQTSGSNATHKLLCKSFLSRTAIQCEDTGAIPIEATPMVLCTRCSSWYPPYYSVKKCPDHRLLTTDIHQQIRMTRLYWQQITNPQALAKYGPPLLPLKEVDACPRENEEQVFRLVEQEEEEEEYSFPQKRKGLWRKLFPKT